MTRSGDVYAGAPEPSFDSRRSFDRDRLRELKRPTRHPDGEHRYGSIFPGDWLSETCVTCCEVRSPELFDVPLDGVCRICRTGAK